MNSKHIAFPNQMGQYSSCCRVHKLQLNAWIVYPTALKLNCRLNSSFEINMFFSVISLPTKWAGHKSLAHCFHSLSLAHRTPSLSLTLPITYRCPLNVFLSNFPVKVFKPLQGFPPMHQHTDNAHFMYTRHSRIRTRHMYAVSYSMRHSLYRCRWCAVGVCMLSVVLAVVVSWIRNGGLHSILISSIVPRHRR